MSVDKTALFLKLDEIHFEIVKQSKRIIKKKVPKSTEVRQDIRNNLVKYFNQFTNLLAKSWNSLDINSQNKCKQIFHGIRDKVIKSFLSLNVKYKVPYSCVEKIDPTIFDEDGPEEIEDSQSDSDSEKMATTNNMSAVEFFNLASKIIPTQFDGNPNNLLSFLDSLELLKINCLNQENNAVSFVKTRLTAKARNLINNETTLDEIILKLKSNIKGESSRLITSKLLNLKQNNKDATDFANEVGNLAEKLQQSYISEGVPASVAQNYTVETTTQALSQNAFSEKVRLIIEAGSFTSVQEIITKFVNASSKNNETSMFYVRSNRRPYNARNMRGRGYRNFNSNTYTHRGRGQFSRVSGNYETRGRGNHITSSNYGRGQGRNNYYNNVRFCSQDVPENQSDPQPVRLGETEM